MGFSVLAMTVAAFVESKRLKFVPKEIIHGGKRGPLSMIVFCLAPRYLILGSGDGFTLVGLQEYFYAQVPASMRNLGIALYLTIIGIGSYLNSFLIIIVDLIGGKGDKNLDW